MKNTTWNEIKTIIDTFEEEYPEDPMNAIKGVVAWILGIDEFSDEWDDLMEIFRRCEHET